MFGQKHINKPGDCRHLNFLLICGVTLFFCLFRKKNQHFYFISVRKVTQLLHMHHDYHIFQVVWQCGMVSHMQCSENTGKIYFHPIIFIILMVYVNVCRFCLAVSHIYYIVQNLCTHNANER